MNDDRREQPTTDGVADPATRTVRLLSRPCSTCVTFPDDRMYLGERRRQFIDEAVAQGNFVVCHDTLTGPKAICRGFWNLHAHNSAGCRLVQAFAIVTEIDPPIS